MEAWNLGDTCLIVWAMKPTSDPLLREELLAARASIRAQLERLERPFVAGVGIMGGPPDNQSLIETLEQQLAEIEDAISADAPDT